MTAFRKREKPGFIRRLLERAEAAELQAMFDTAWDTLPEAERAAIKEERAAWLGTFAGRKEP
jgi:hypothetical protein